jgi:Flp pilus assembly pilin Flp
MRRFFSEERGATSAEYVLIIAVLGLGAFVAIPGFSDLLAHRLTGAMDAVQQLTRGLGY